jgi:hypothetical protein
LILVFKFFYIKMPSFYLSTWEKEDFIDWYGLESGTKLWNEQISNKYIQQIAELKQRVSELEGIIEHSKDNSVSNTAP